MGRNMLWSTGYTACLLEASNLMVSGGHLSWTASIANDITFSAYLIAKFKGRSGHGWIQALNAVGRVCSLLRLRASSVCFYSAQVMAKWLLQISSHPFQFLLWQLWQLDKEMATHSSILTWDIPWGEEPGRLQSMGISKESDTAKQLSTSFDIRPKTTLR